MEKYHFTKEQLGIYEKDEIPFAIYQFVNQKVVTLALSKGFLDMFEFDDFKVAYYEMDNEMYKYAHPDDVARVSNVAIAFATGEVAKYDVVYRTRLSKGRDYYIIHALGKHIILDDGTKVAQIWYISEGKYNPQSNISSNLMNQALNNVLYKTSTIQRNDYDYLTGLPTMSRFFEISTAERDKMVKDGLDPVIIFLDFSGMKYFNSKYGFSEGNKLFVEFSKLISKYYSVENCSHLGQDHFGIVTSYEKAIEYLPKIFEEVKHINDGKTLPLRVGIYKNSMEDVDAAIACDRAKIACNSLRNTYESGYRIFDDKMKEQVYKRQYIIDNIDKAIEEKWIKVYYQPIIRAVSGRVCEEEALARWIDPVKGVLSPGEFVPILESIKQIHKLDLYVLSEVLEKIKLQDERGLYIVPQSINLSRYDFEVCDIVEEIRKKVDKAGISHDKITIEVTESVVGSDFDFIKSQIEKFREYGFPVWLDDFGSGYSSLNTLQSIKFDLIKFDMKFISHLNEDLNNAVVLSELIKMVSALNIDNVCEGVETKEQVKFLQEIGCSKLQGYYFTKPLPVEEVFLRYKRGIQIGFENLELTDYYDTIGRTNLYDMSMITSGEDYSLQGFYNTMPAAIVEINKDGIKYIRNNISFRNFMQHNIGIDISEEKDTSKREVGKYEENFIKVLKSASKSANRLFVDEKLPDDSIAHCFIKRVAVNPISGSVAVFISVLSIVEAKTGTTYANIARALARDYFILYYVNLETDNYIEYNSDAGSDEITLEKHDTDFFNRARKEALSKLYVADRPLFLKEFTKENILKELKLQGTFTFTYRLLTGNTPIYANMKVMMMSPNDKYIIIGVSNVDYQMRQKEALERIKQEQNTYLRMKALSDDYMCIFTVDPITDEYVECSGRQNNDGLEISKQGDDFFKTTYELSHTFIYEKDRDNYFKEFTKEKILNQIKKQGLYLLNYHLVVNNELIKVEIRAVMVDEEDGQKLIIGLIKKN